MDFPITELLDEELSTHWLLKHFHPDGLQCPRCGSREEEARTFRRTRRSGQFTHPTAQVYTDESDSYHQLQRAHATVCHAIKEWARDDDGDGIREVHTNTMEGMWTGVRTFLRSFRGVHKRSLGGYIAICEFAINLKRISPAFLSALVRVHTFQT